LNAHRNIVRFAMELIGKCGEKSLQAEAGAADCQEML
jgi:hypothetical protein